MKTFLKASYRATITAFIVLHITFLLTYFNVHRFSPVVFITVLWINIACYLMGIVLLLLTLKQKPHTWKNYALLMAFLSLFYMMALLSDPFSIAGKVLD